MLFRSVLEKGDVHAAKKIAAWLTSDVQAMVVAQKITWDDAKLDGQSMLVLAAMVEDKKVSSTAAKQILEELVLRGGDPLKIAEDKKLLQVSDEGAVGKIVDAVIADNPQAVADVKAGEMKAIGYLVGQVMKHSKGQANPSLAQKLLKEKIG